MTEITNSGYYYPNKLGRIILLSFQEVLGRDGMREVLNHCQLSQYVEHLPPNNDEPQFLFEHLSRIHVQLEEMYGRRGGQGLALRSGRACLKHGLREFGPILEINAMAFKLMPLRQKLAKGAGLFARAFNELTDQQVQVTEEGEQILWKIQRCPVCWQRQVEHPACHLFTGMLQEAFYWISGGKTFLVQETTCVAQGDPCCTMAIDKHPLQ